MTGSAGKGRLIEGAAEDGDVVGSIQSAQSEALHGLIRETVGVGDRDGVRTWRHCPPYRRDKYHWVARITETLLPSHVPSPNGILSCLPASNSSMKSDRSVRRDLWQGRIR